MGIRTDALAAKNHVKPESVISRYSRTGTYFGLRPTKLPNGRLDWPDDPPEAAAGTPAAAEQAAA